MIGRVAPTGMKPQVDHRRHELATIDDQRWRDYHDLVWSPFATVEERRDAFESAVESLETLLAYDQELRG